MFPCSLLITMPWRSMGECSIAPRFPSRGTRRRRVAALPPERIPAPTRQEVRWGQEPVWTPWRNSLAPARDRSPSSSAVLPESMSEHGAQISREAWMWWAVREGESLGTAAPNWHTVSPTAPDDRWVWATAELMGGENGNAWRHTSPNATNTTRTISELNLDRHAEKPATNRLNYGTVKRILKFVCSVLCHSVLGRRPAQRFILKYQRIHSFLINSESEESTQTR
jgi:hypothetical protein